MSCRHLVIAGGGPGMFFTGLGCLQTATEEGLLSRNTLNTVHGVSAGCLVSVAFLLFYPWCDLREYAINRPWDDSLASTIFKAIKGNSIDTEELVGVILHKLLDGAGLDRKITLAQFYEHTSIDFNILATEIYEHSRCVESLINHRNSPDLPLIKAVAMSCAIPFAFRPVVHEGRIYVDGGIMNNYPIDLVVGKHSEILGICLAAPPKECNIDELVKSSSKLNQLLITRLVQGFDSKLTAGQEYRIFDGSIVDYSTLDVWMSALISQDKRAELYKGGQNLQLVITSVTDSKTPGGNPVKEQHRSQIVEHRDQV